MKTMWTASALALALATLGPTWAGAQEPPAAGPAEPQAQLAHWFGWGEGGHGRHGDRHSRGRGDEAGFRHGGPRMERFLEEFDANKDGALTQEEIDDVRRDQLAKFDSNKDGRLSLDEFQALWAEQMRERMVRGFQRLDRDGDGQVTAEELNDRLAGLVQRLDRNGDGKLSREDRRFDRDGDRRGPPMPDEDAGPDEAPPPPQP